MMMVRKIAPSRSTGRQHAGKSVSRSVARPTSIGQRNPIRRIGLSAGRHDHLDRVEYESDGCQVRQEIAWNSWNIACGGVRGRVCRQWNCQSRDERKNTGVATDSLSHRPPSCRPKPGMWRAPLCMSDARGPILSPVIEVVEILLADGPTGGPDRCARVVRLPGRRCRNRPSR